MRDPIGTSIWRFPFDTEIDRAMETSIIGTWGDFSLGSISRSVTIGTVVWPSFALWSDEGSGEIASGTPLIITLADGCDEGLSLAGGTGA